MRTHSLQCLAAALGGAVFSTMVPAVTPPPEPIDAAAEMFNPVIYCSALSQRAKDPSIAAGCQAEERAAATQLQKLRPPQVLLNRCIVYSETVGIDTGLGPPSYALTYSCVKGAQKSSHDQDEPPQP